MNITKDTHNIRRGLSDREAVLLSTLAMKGKSIIGYGDVSDTLDTSYQNARKVVQRLSHKKWLLPIMGGRYLISPLAAGSKSEYTEHEFVVASSLAAKRPYYVAYWSALNYYGYTEQTPVTVFLATTARIPRMTIHGVEYMFVTIREKKFFGTVGGFVAGQTFTISDRDKTIVDALDHPEYCGGIDTVARCLWNARKDISFERILEYAQAMQNSTIIKRMGYLADVLGIAISTPVYDRMHAMIRPGRSLLDTLSASRNGKFNAKWNLLVNRSTDAILDAKSIT